MSNLFLFLKIALWIAIPYLSAVVIQNQLAPELELISFIGMGVSALTGIISAEYHLAILWKRKWNDKKIK